MKTQKLIFVCLLIFVLACKKERDNTSRCNIATMTQAGPGGNAVYTFTYNDEGKLATMDVGGTGASHKDFAYSSNTVFIVTLDPDGKFKRKDSIAIDSKGRPLNIRSFTSADGSTWENTSFEYNGDDLKNSALTYNYNSTPMTTTFTYSNGNPVIMATGGSSTILEYFTDKKVQKGDYLEMASLVQNGVNIYPHKNMVKLVASGGSIVNFAYEYNSDGLVSKVTITSGTDIALLTYTYECK